MVSCIYFIILPIYLCTLRSEGNKIYYYYILFPGLWGFCHMLVKTGKTVLAKIGYILAKSNVNHAFCTICQQITMHKVKTNFSSKLIKTVWMNFRRQSSGIF